ncbi:hypothetical protein [Chryseosolibacter indicus]|uniref:Sulfate ABC transporter permease n=1 Tax=Chryseosolibacter indicus TaxID=2782351 RepID=A0ABS5VMM0_9BACT|nr:hypothetical protein [Chryseosolibacter indicus]MBT1702022.1 hypothetical protein [Chryseosolibacter indicus]
MINSATENETKSLFGASKRLLFLLLCLATLLLLFIKISFIENETAAFEFLQDKPEGSILQLINTLKYISIPIVYLWKFTVIAFVIWVGCFMFGYKVTYKECWGVVISAEFVFLIPEILKIVWFMTIETDPSYHDIRAFYPFSLMHFADYYSLDKRYAYPLRALNLFEVIYWIILVNGIDFYAQKDKKYVWIIVACSYILLFALWLLFYITVYK